MMIPVPSLIRVVRIYGERAPARSSGLVGPSTRYKWPAKHALDTDWWWVNATAWCQDIDDTLLAPPATTITPATNNLAIIATAISADGLQAGFLLTGGAAGVDYTITIRLIGRATGASWAGAILLPLQAVTAIDPPPSNAGTMNGSVLTVGGVTLVPGQPT